MPTVLTCLLRLGLALAFVAGVAAQLTPAAMAQARLSASAGMIGGCDGPKPPCTGHTPSCGDHLGCITVCALPISPTAIAVPVEWTSLDYDFLPQPLAGITVKPELSPPIIAA